MGETRQNLEGQEQSGALVNDTGILIALSCHCDCASETQTLRPKFRMRMSLSQLN